MTRRTVTPGLVEMARECIAAYPFMTITSAKLARELGVSSHAASVILRRLGLKKWTRLQYIVPGSWLDTPSEGTQA
jgi:hypothetical protein